MVIWTTPGRTMAATSAITPPPVPGIGIGLADIAVAGVAVSPGVGDPRGGIVAMDPGAADAAGDGVGVATLAAKATFVEGWPLVGVPWIPRVTGRLQPARRNIPKVGRVR